MLFSNLPAMPASYRAQAMVVISLAYGQFRSIHPAKNTIQQVPGRAAQAKSNKYATRKASKFVPLVFSLGGAMETRCSTTSQDWREHMPIGSHSFLLKRRILLLRARFRFYEAVGGREAVEAVGGSRMRRLEVTDGHFSLFILDPFFHVYPCN
jgi:hypothetical protein